MPDLSKLSDADLMALNSGDLSKVSNEGLMALNGSPAAPSAPDTSFTGFVKSLGNNFVRAGVKAVSGLPLMAQDMGVAARNVYEDASSNGIGAAAGHLLNPAGANYPYQLPSATVNNALDSVTNAPATTSGKIGEFLSSALLGSRLPAPTAETQVPSNFVPSATTAQQTFGQSRNAGYVVPPSTTNPTVGNKIFESLGGKIATAQDASLANMPVTNNLARSALGLAKDQDITPSALAAVRAQAGQAYKGVISAMGDTLPTDAAYTAKLAEVGSKYTQAEQELGAAFGNPQLTNIVEALDKPQMSPDTAIKATQILRDKADMAFQSGDKQLGKSFKDLASNIEDLIERHLSETGQQDALKQMQEARQLIAKTYSVQSALNPATGNVSAIKLGQQLAKGKPLSGDLFTAAQAGQAFPKATKEILDSGSVRNTDVILGGLASLAKQDPKLLLYPFARQGARSFLLSGVGQNLAQPGSAMPATGLAALSQSVLAQWDLAK